jgi:hypothetical protein
MQSKIRYPPCRLGLFSERPVRHNFKIAFTRDGEPIQKVRDGIYYYHVICERCGFIDPHPPSF